MEGNQTEWTVPAQLRRRAEERPDDIAHRLVDVDDPTVGRWDRESTAAARAAGSPEPLPDLPAPGDEAEIIYTSGTTGVPKGVVAAHENLLRPLRPPHPGRTRTALHALPPGRTVGPGLPVQLSARPHRTATLSRFAAGDLLDATSLRAFAARVDAAPAREAVGHRE